MTNLSNGLNLVFFLKHSSEFDFARRATLSGDTGLSVCDCESKLTAH